MFIMPYPKKVIYNRHTKYTPYIIIYPYIYGYTYTYPHIDKYK